MKQRNYDEYDYMRILINKNVFDEIMLSYSCFGWEIYEKHFSSVFSDTIELTLRRSRWVKNKDKLQLMQVYMESGYADIGKLRKRKYLRSTILGLSVGTIATLLLSLFLYFTITSSHLATIICGSVVCVLIASVLVRLLFALASLKKTEDKQYLQKRKEIIIEIEKICKDASATIGGGGNAQD